MSPRTRLTVAAADRRAELVLWHAPCGTRATTTIWPATSPTSSPTTLLTNPWYLLWDEFGPDDVVRIDIDGNVLEGRWPAAPGVHLHLAMHRVRDDVGVSIHNHPRWVTVWADARRIPGVLDQTVRWAVAGW